MRILWLTFLLAGSVIWAERQHYPQSNAKTWQEARLYCQECFKDLTTITSRNVHDIAQNLISDCWVGLRRSLNGSIPWSRWSNGDPVTYQNWYPGHPVPKIETCTPNSTLVNSTTAPKMNNTEDQCPLVMEILTCINMTFDELENITGSLVKPHTPPPTVNITFNNTCDTEAEKYIDDSCVALLSFGMWKEKLCNENLPFICYDERFLGEINISKVTKSEGYLDWSPGPGSISHYRVEVTGGKESLICNETGQQLVNLIAGTRYDVQVYPVKCGRDLNPQNISFYTSPSDILGLSVTDVTNISVALSWNHSGNCDFYFVKVLNNNESNLHKILKSTKTVIQSLIPGEKYSFTVSAVVNETTESVPETVSTFIKPSPVRNLTSADNSHTVITAFWNAPEGMHSEYIICINEVNANLQQSCSKLENCSKLGNCSNLENGSNLENCSYTKDEQFEFKDKMPGNIYFVCVAALTDNKLFGESVQIEAYTRPSDVTLNLEASNTDITASWTLLGTYKEFNVTIEAPGTVLNKNTANYNYLFTNLKAGVSYTVTVITLSEKVGLTSDPVQKSIYTRPTPPSWINAIAYNQSSISLTWGVPKESEGFLNINYRVECFSVYWGNGTCNETKENITITGLQSGTNYKCSVCVLAGKETSPNVSVSAETKPNKQTLTFAMLCTSKTPLHCASDTVRSASLKELNDTFYKELDGIYWNLKMIDRK